MLKIVRLSNLALKTFKANNNKIVKVGDRTNETVVNSIKNLIYVPNIRVTKKSIFLILNIKKVFNHLKQALIKAWILQYFDIKSHIWIKINRSRYVIGAMFS